MGRQEEFGEGFGGQGGRLVGAGLPDFRGHVPVEPALGTNGHSPTMGADDALENLRGALVDRRDADVPANFFDFVLVGVAVAAVGLDRRIGRRVPGLGCEELGDRPLDLEPLLSTVEATGNHLAVGPSGFQPNDVGQDQLVGEALFGEENLAELGSFVSVADRALDRFLPGAEAEGCDHQPGKAEDLVGLVETVALLEAEELSGGNLDAVEDHLGRIGSPDAVLDFVVPDAQTLGRSLDDEERRPAGGAGENGVEIGDPAVGDELFGARDPVGDDSARGVGDGVGDGCQGGDVAARRRFGDGIPDDQPFLGDPAEPRLPLLVGAADDDRVDSQRDGEECRRHAEVDARHFLRNSQQVPSAAPETADLFGQKDQVEPDFRPQQFGDQLGWKGVLGIETEAGLDIELALCEGLEGLQDEFEALVVEADRHLVHGGLLIPTFRERHYPRSDDGGKEDFDRAFRTSACMQESQPSGRSANSPSTKPATSSQPG